MIVVTHLKGGSLHKNELRLHLGAAVLAGAEEPRALQRYGTCRGKRIAAEWIELLEPSVRLPSLGARLPRAGSAWRQSRFSQHKTVTVHASVTTLSQQSLGLLVGTEG